MLLTTWCSRPKEVVGNLISNASGVILFVVVVVVRQLVGFL
jgi:hypothetical protein